MTDKEEQTYNCTNNSEGFINISKILQNRNTLDQKYKETILDTEFCKRYFKCPLCGKKALISEAKHHSKETKRTLIATSYDKNTYEVTYHNFRICEECDQKIKKGNIFAFILWGVLGVIFYTIFAYIYFYTDNLCGTNYLLEPLYERSEWNFFFIFLGLTIFGSWIVLAFCFSICDKYYKNLSWEGFSYKDAYWGNAIAPINEKDK